MRGYGVWRLSRQSVGVRLDWPRNLHALVGQRLEPGARHGRRLLSNRRIDAVDNMLARAAGPLACGDPPEPQATHWRAFPKDKPVDRHKNRGVLGGHRIQQFGDPVNLALAPCARTDHPHAQPQVWVGLDGVVRVDGGARKPWLKPSVVNSPVPNSPRARPVTAGAIAPDQNNFTLLRHQEPRLWQNNRACSCGQCRCRWGFWRGTSWGSGDRNGVRSPASACAGNLQDFLGHVQSENSSSSK